jgi:hypothetical protein
MTVNSNSEKQKFEKEMRERDKRLENSEYRVIEALEKKANFEGWETDEKHVHPGEGGIDLKLKRRNDNRIIVIEAKGERANQRNAKGRVALALGQITMDMKNEEPEKDYRYCLAFPATEAFRKCKIPTRPRQRLGLNIIFVECTTGLLTVYQPDTKDVIDLKTFNELFHVG